MDPTPDQGGPAIDGALGKPAMARTLAYLFLASASLALAGLAVPHDGELSVPGMLAVIGAGAAVGVVLLARAPRLKPATIPALLVGGTALATAAVWFDGNADSAYALLYVWIGVEAFYFLPRWQAALELAVVGGAYAGVIALFADGSAPVERWILTIGTAAAAGVLVHQLRDRIDRLMIRLAGAAGSDPLTG